MKSQNIEKVEPLFFDENAIIGQPEPVYRLDQYGERFYYSVDADGVVKTAPSATTIISGTSKTPEYLIKWIAEHGVSKANDLRDSAADYGTLLHQAVASLLVNKSFNLDMIEAYVREYVNKRRLRWNTRNWPERLASDLVAFNAFAERHNLTPLAIEVTLFSDYGYAGTCDLVCEIDVGTGTNCSILKRDKETKRKRVLIDLKSSRKSFYDEHGVQLAFYRMLWNESFPQYPVENILNWRPKDWNDKPDWQLKDWQNIEELTETARFSAILFNVRSAGIKERFVNEFSGVIKLAENSADNYKRESVNELAVTSASEKAARIGKLAFMAGELYKSTVIAKEEITKTAEALEAGGDNVVEASQDESKPTKEVKKDEAPPKKKRTRRTKAQIAADKKAAEERKAAEEKEAEEEARKEAIENLPEETKSKALTILAKVNKAREEINRLRVKVGEDENIIKQHEKGIESLVDPAAKAEIEGEIFALNSLVNGYRDAINNLDKKEIPKLESQLHQLLEQPELFKGVK